MAPSSKNVRSNVKSKRMKTGEKLVQETRGWNEEKHESYVQRSEEDAHDYRYFPEPDLPEMKIDPAVVKELKDNLPELPWVKMQGWTERYGLIFGQC